MSFGDSVEYRQPYTKEFGNVLSRLLKQKRFYQKSKYGALARAWTKAAGEEISSCTKISSFRHGRLRINVNSSIMLQELSGFRKQSLLNRLQETEGGEDVIDLQFFLNDGSEET